MEFKKKKKPYAIQYIQCTQLFKKKNVYNYVHNFPKNIHNIVH